MKKQKEKDHAMTEAISYGLICLAYSILLWAHVARLRPPPIFPGQGGFPPTAEAPADPEAPSTPPDQFAR